MAFGWIRLLFVSWFGWIRSQLGRRGWKQRARLLFLGLDNTGKSTLFNFLVDGRIRVVPPTHFPSCEELCVGNTIFRTFDLGGHEFKRKAWRDYYDSLDRGVDGIFFFVDASDRNRFEEARQELGRLLDNPAIADVHIAVIGNKIDLPSAALEDELRSALGLPCRATSSQEDLQKANAHDTGPCRPALFMASTVKRIGYREAFAWLSELI